MGALEFEPMIKRGKNTPQALEIDDLVRLAKDALEQKEGLATDLTKNEGKHYRKFSL